MRRDRTMPIYEPKYNVGDKVWFLERRSMLSKRLSIK